ncbi:MAG: hypothetical protein MHMPM18_000200 [Marteilia pararefringens]
MIFALGGDNEERQILAEEVRRLRCKRLIEARTCDGIKKLRESAKLKAIEEVKQEMKLQKRAEIQHKIRQLEERRAYMLQIVGKMHYSATIINEVSIQKAEKIRESQKNTRKLIFVSNKNFIAKRNAAIVALNEKKQRRSFLRDIERFRARRLVYLYRKKKAKEAKKSPKILSKATNQDFSIIPSPSYGRDLKANASRLTEYIINRDKLNDRLISNLKTKRLSRGKNALIKLKNEMIYNNMLAELSRMQQKELVAKKKRFMPKNHSHIKFPDNLNFISQASSLDPPTNIEKYAMPNSIEQDIEAIKVKKDPNNATSSLKVTDSGIIVKKHQSSDIVSNSRQSIHQPDNDPKNDKKDEIQNIFNLIRSQKNFRQSNEKSPDASIVDQTFSTRNNRTNLSSDRSIQYKYSQPSLISSISRNSLLSSANVDLNTLNNTENREDVDFDDNFSKISPYSVDDFELSILSKKFEDIHLKPTLQHQPNIDSFEDDARMIKYQRLSSSDVVVEPNPVDEENLQQNFTSIEESGSYYKLSNDNSNELGDAREDRSLSLSLPSRTSILLNAYRRSVSTNSNSMQQWDSVSESSRKSRLSHLIKTFTKKNSNP